MVLNEGNLKGGKGYKMSKGFQSYVEALNPVQKQKALGSIARLDLNDPNQRKSAAVILKDELNFKFNSFDAVGGEVLKEVVRIIRNTEASNEDKEVLLKRIDSIRGECAKVLDLSKAKKVGQGGTHNVREVDGLIVKTKLKGLGKDQARKEASFSDAVRKHFSDHATSELVTTLGVKEKDRTIANRHVVVQRKETIFNKRRVVDFSTAHPEDYVDDTEDYHRCNIGFLTGGKANLDAYSSVDVKLKSLFKKIKKDEELRDLIANDFLNRVVNFFNETRQFIDISGARNIVFYKERGVWTYKMGSVIKHESRDEFEETLAMLEKGDLTQLLNAVDKDRLGRFLDSLNSIRLMNACGLACGKGKIFNYSLTPKQLMSLDQLRQMKLSYVKKSS